MPKITVATPTIRGLQALRSVEQSLKEQTCQDFEWLIEYGDGRIHELNAAYNRMLRRASGELLVSAQDWLWFPPDGLQKFWEAYRSKPGYFFTAPVPKTPSYAEIRNVLQHHSGLYMEWRSQSPGEIDWSRWEIDWGAAPLQPLLELGGFDEMMDAKWGNDNTNLAYRASRQGWKFRNVIENPAVALAHDKLFAHPFRHRHDPKWSEARLRDFDDGWILPEMSRSRPFYIPPGIDGWMSEMELQWLFKTALHMRRIAEIGCWKGRSTHALCAACWPGKVHAIDHFRGAKGDEEAHKEAQTDAVYRQFLENMKSFDNLILQKMCSLEAAALYPDKHFDMVFLDGGHLIEEVREDLRAWLPKTRRLICGHDYGTGTPGVMQAVNELFGEVDTHDLIWAKWIC